MINMEHYLKESEIVGDSSRDTELLRSMACDARAYLRGFVWCPPIKNLYLAAGIGGVVAVFLLELSKKIDDVDDFLWVITGDLPTAYLVTDMAQSPREALHVYYRLMEEWVDAVEGGKDLAKVFPVPVQPTLENARRLTRRIRSLKETVEHQLFPA